MSKKLGIIVYYFILGSLAAGFIYYTVERRFSFNVSVLYICALLVFFIAANKSGLIKVPASFRMPLLTQGPKWSSLTKGILCVPACLAWGFIGGRVVNAARLDNWIGIAIVFVPGIFIAVIGAIYVIQALAGTSKR
jgi:hypothetical protein